MMSAILWNTVQYVQHYRVGVSRISPYYTMFLMFHNFVHFIVQHQFADGFCARAAGMWAAGVLAAVHVENRRVVE